MYSFEAIGKVEKVPFGNEPDYCLVKAPLPTRLSTLSLRRSAVLGVGILAVVVLIQYALGAFASERVNYSDESAHFMNGLLLRDYLREGFPGSPVAFAERYYLNYPKIAPMMWPPLFHVTLGLLMLFGGSPHTLSLLLVASATAWTAWRLFRIVATQTSTLPAFAAVALFLSTSVVLNLTTAVMLDMVVAAFALEGTYWFAKFLTRWRRHQAVVFGLLVAGACMTKGNGLACVLVPPIFIVLSGRFDLLRSKGIWFSALMVLAFAGPPVSYSLLMDSQIGDFNAVTWSRMVWKTGAGVSHIALELGWPAAIVAVVGASTALWKYWHEGERSERVHQIIALFALILGAVTIHAISPLRVVDSRYFAMALAPAWALIAVACAPLLKIGNPARHWVWASAIVLIFFTSAYARPSIEHRGPSGYREVTKWLGTENRLAGKRVLILSDENGEGAFVSEIATMGLASRPTILRGTKLLGTDNWNGQHFSMVFASSAALERELQDLHIDTLVLDDALAEPYADQVRGLFRGESAKLKEIRPSDAGGRRISVYELMSVTSGRRKPVRVTISPTGQVLETID